jgi:hypothetical protein
MAAVSAWLFIVLKMSEILQIQFKSVQCYTALFKATGIQTGEC